MPLTDSRNKTAPYCKSNWLLPLTDWLELLQAATWNIIWADDLPPKAKNKFAKTFFQTAVWEDGGEKKNEKLTKLEPQALESQSAITDFLFRVVIAFGAKHFNLCLCSVPFVAAEPLIQQSSSWIQDVEEDEGDGSDCHRAGR